MTAPASLYPDDKRGGDELVAAIRAASTAWSPSKLEQCHYAGCSSLTRAPVLRECDCGLPDLLARLWFALGTIHGMWHKATAEDVVRILAHAVAPDPERTDQPESEAT